MLINQGKVKVTSDWHMKPYLAFDCTYQNLVSV